MIFLKNDYSLGCHPAVLQALVDSNMELHDGYCEDDYCRKAADRIRQLTDCPEADVHFVPGGTLMNLTALAAFLLRPHWSVISADSGHICVHETGAIEATGHKINHVKTADGKLRPEDIEEVLIFHEDEHYVLPKAIYISNSTETGLIYTKEELMALFSETGINLQSGWRRESGTGESHLFGIPVSALPGLNAYLHVENGFISVLAANGNDENVMQFLRILCQDMVQAKAVD